MSTTTTSTAKHRCKTCHDKGSVTCPKCDGKKEFECEKCHGKGHFSSCSKCGSTGKVTCSTCYGSGKVEVDCPVCDRGYVPSYEWINCNRCNGTGINGDALNGNCISCNGTGKVKNPIRKLCPNCHGDYKGFKGKKTCGVCGGSGEERCDRCRGTGKAICKTCDGEGKVKCERCKGKGLVKCPECKKREEKEAQVRRERAAAEQERNRPSYQNRARFMMLGVLFGLLGVHYAYIRRWFLFLIQLALTGFGVAQCMIPSLGQPVTNFLLPHIEKLEGTGLYCLGDALRHPVLLLALAWSLLGAILVRKDGTNHKMRYEPEKWGFILIVLVQLALMLYAFGKTGLDAESMRSSILLQVGIVCWTIPFLYAKQWKYFFISFLPVLVDVAFLIGIGPFKLWNNALGLYFCWHIWAVIRTTKEL